MKLHCLLIMTQPPNLSTNAYGWVPRYRRSCAKMEDAMSTETLALIFSGYMVVAALKILVHHFRI